MVSITRALGLLSFATVALYSVVGASASSTNGTMTVLDTGSGFQECPTAPASPQDRRPDTSKLKYATYNCEFLFLVGYGQLACPGADCKWKDETAAQNHIKQIARNIKALDADIVHMNEVEDCAVLNAVIAELQALGDNTYQPYLIGGADSATGQNAALITRVDPIVDLQRTEQMVRLPVAQSKCPSASGFSSSKGVAKHFYTTFQVSGFSAPVTVIGAHLLAAPSNKARCFEREGQATILSSLALKAAANGNHVIISGDMNDFSASVLDRNNNRPNSNALEIMEGQGFSNVAKFADKMTRYTQWWDRNNDCVFLQTETSSLDHIIVSQSLLKGSSPSVAFRNDLYQASCGGFNSDHFPVTMTLSPV